MAALFIMYTPIMLDKSRNLKYGMRGISLIENKLDKPLSDFNLRKLTMTELSVFIWAGLVHEDKDLTPDIVMDLIDEYSSIPEISASLWKAIEASFRKNARRAAGGSGTGTN